MADEITLNASLAVNATNFVEAFNPGRLTIDLADVKGDGTRRSVRRHGRLERRRLLLPQP